MILSQAMRIAIPLTVGFVALTRAGHLMVNVTYQPMIAYPLVAALYFAVCWPVSFTAGRLEARLDMRSRI